MSGFVSVLYADFVYKASFYLFFWALRSFLHGPLHEFITLTQTLIVILLIDLFNQLISSLTKESFFLIGGFNSIIGVFDHGERLLLLTFRLDYWWKKRVIGYQTINTQVKQVCVIREKLIEKSGQIHVWKQGNFVLNWWYLGDFHKQNWPTIGILILFVYVKSRWTGIIISVVYISPPLGQKKTSDREYVDPVNTCWTG